MEKKTSLPVILSYIYLVLPILIFIIGWCNLPTIIISGLIILISFYFVLKNSTKIWYPENKQQKFLLLGIFLITIFWVYSSGIGALVFQNYDHCCRNPIFENLVQYAWPVEHSNHEAILTYYIGFWLVPACIGKLFHSIQIGYLAQIIWASIGIFLFFYYVLSNLKKKNLLPIIIFIFFSGLDYIGNLLFLRLDNVLSITSHLEWWFPFQFSSMTTQLFWVFNQALPAWLTVMVLYNEKNNKNIFFLYSCLFINSTLPAIGMLPFLIYWWLKNDATTDKEIFSLDHIKKALLNSITFQNVIGCFTLFIISYSYLHNNIAGASTKVGTPQFLGYVIFLLTFFLLEVGIYLLCIFKENRNKILFYIMTLCFLVYPFLRIGNGPDFCMRATIPALIILYLFIIQKFDLTEKINKGLIVLIITLAIGAVTPIHEFARTIFYTSKGITKIQSQLGYENFYGLKKNNSFIKYFSKK